MNIGIIGSGNIGGLLGKLWAQAGHKVLFSSRHPRSLRYLVKEAGHNASRGSVDDAIEFGDVILLSIPYGMTEEFGREHADPMAGKIVIDTGNPYPERDGPIAQEVRSSGTG